MKLNRYQFMWDLKSNYNPNYQFESEVNYYDSLLTRTGKYLLILFKTSLWWILSPILIPVLLMGNTYKEEYQ